MSTIILYNEKTQEREILQRICNNHHIDIIDIEKKDLGQKVGYLAGLDGFTKNDKEEDRDDRYDFTFMLFKDMDNAEIFAFIDDMKKENLYIPNKAALTQNNIHRTLKYLLEENIEEHETMMLIQEINTLAKKAHDHKLQHGENQEIKETIMEINAYFKDPTNFSLEKAKAHKENLQKLVDALES